MFWMFLLAVVLGLVFFKLGVYSVVSQPRHVRGEGAVLRDAGCSCWSTRALDRAAAATRIGRAARARHRVPVGRLIEE